MFERLQQPISFKLPRRGAKSETTPAPEATRVDPPADAGGEAPADSGGAVTETSFAHPAPEEPSASEHSPLEDAPSDSALPEISYAYPTGEHSPLEDAPSDETSYAYPNGEHSLLEDAASDETSYAHPGSERSPLGDAPDDSVAADDAPSAFDEPTPLAVAPALAAVEPVEAPADDVAEDAAPQPSSTRRLRSVRLHMPRRSATSNLIGLDIEPGQIVAVQAHVNGAVVVERAAGMPLAPDVIRDGEVNDPEALREALSALFEQSKLDRRVRIGIANQRIVMRRIELPPITDAKEIASAVRFQAADEIPMPLDSVVLDYHSLGIVDTPAGPRLHVVLVAARRDMVERVLGAARAAGLRPEGIDLAAFAMIRALRRGDRDSTEQVLYLSIGGITNLAIASGATCEFTRAIGTGIEQIVAEVASRCGIALGDARRLLAHVAEMDAATSLVVVPPPRFEAAQDAAVADHESAARIVLSDGVRRIAGEVRHSLDFHVSSSRGQGVARAVLCGPALDVPGFMTMLAGELGMPISAGNVALASPGVADQVPASRLTVAAGLAVEDGPA